MTDGDTGFSRERADLFQRGYKDVAEFRGLTVGARVRHVGEQYFEAHERGTGTIVALMERPSVSARPDIELIVRRDVDRGGFGLWADYHTVLAGTSAI